MNNSNEGMYIFLFIYLWWVLEIHGKIKNIFDIYSEIPI
jgi:hypothetical protein